MTYTLSGGGKENFGPMLSEKVWSRKEKNIFHNDTILVPVFLYKTRKFSHTSPFHPHPKQHRIFSVYLCAVSRSIKYLKKPSTTKNYNNSMGWWFVKLIPYQTGNSKIINKKDAKFLSRMCMNSYVPFKEQLPTGCKSMSTSNYTTQFHNALWQEWWQEKRRATGTSGTKNSGTKSKHLRKLPLKQD